MTVLSGTRSGLHVFVYNVYIFAECGRRRTWNRTGGQVLFYLRLNRSGGRRVAVCLDVQ